MSAYLFRSPPRLALTPLATALLLAATHAHAYQAGVPNSGSILQQVQPVLPPAPAASQPGLRIEPVDTPGSPASAAFVVKTIRITGSTAFAAETLHALVADAEGKRMSLPELEQLAGRITAWYQDRGFPLSRAIVPAQTVAGGEVMLRVVEAHYGAVQLHNGSRVDDALLAAMLAPLRPGQAIDERGMDRALLLLSDVPGVGVDAVVRPGAEVGAANLDVATGHRARSVASVVLDNGGNRYIGRARAGVTVFAVNPLHHGDVFDAAILGTGRDMQYGRLGYETLLNGSGIRTGASYSAVRYRLGEELEGLDAHGTARVASAWIKHPLLRSRDTNAYAQLEYDVKHLRDHVGATDTHTDRHLGNWMLSLNGDLRDTLLARGSSAWSLGWTRARLGFDDLDAEAADAASARTRGRFSKWNANASHLQGLGTHDALYLNLGAQWSDANLDSAEKMTVGGPYTVRAYDIGAVSGDTGYTATAELRHELARGWQATAFVDSARVKVNRRPWIDAVNTVRLSGAGVGITWSGPDAWNVSASLATPIGAEPAGLARPSSVRAWMTATKGF